MLALLTFMPISAFSTEPSVYPEHTETLTTLNIKRDNQLVSSLAIEIASTLDEKIKGLMHRKTMPLNHGMLFDYSPPQEIHMWMKNTYIPLDMLFLDENYYITHIHHNAKPHDLTIIPSPGIVSGVIEINAGQAKAQDIQVGDRIVIDKTPALSIEEGNQQ
ncbi:MAG: DUF192 domain-containing protein [Alphaproteobacteria bacterium]|nr:DUF192 domain-containing protein [Alphaproteobacteria bacterium]